MANKTVVAKIVHRKDTAANWASKNPILDGGEFGYDTTNNIYKGGDGVTHWNDLRGFSASEFLKLTGGTLSGNLRTSKPIIFTDPNVARIQTETDCLLGRNTFGEMCLSSPNESTNIRGSVIKLNGTNIDDKYAAKNHTHASGGEIDPNELKYYAGATLDKLSFTFNSTTNSFSVKALNTDISGDVVIPSHYKHTNGNWYPVKEIEDYAFVDKSIYLGIGVSSVVIPDTVTTIGSMSFFMCPLKSVKIGNGVTTIKSCAFNQYGSSLKEVEIPSSVTQIESMGFADCSGLQSVTIHGNTTQINSGVFSNCTSLKTLILKGTNVTLSSTDAIPSTIERIVVPSLYVGAYKNMTNWTSFGSKIYPEGCFADWNANGMQQGYIENKPTIKKYYVHNCTFSTTGNQVRIKFISSVSTAFTRVSRLKTELNKYGGQLFGQYYYPGTLFVKTINFYDGNNTQVFLSDGTIVTATDSTTVSDTVNEV